MRGFGTFRGLGHNGVKGSRPLRLRLGEGSRAEPLNLMNSIVWYGVLV